MANAKKCDVCGKYYDVPDINVDIIFDEGRNTSMIRILKRKPVDYKVAHDVMQFDSCEECTQDVIDYILTRRASWEKGETE